MITKHPDLSYVNSSEAYNGEVILQGSRLFIPVVNVGLMEEHPLNALPSGQVFVDRSYLVFKGLKSIVYNERSAGPPVWKEGPNEVFYFGALNLFDPDFYELKIVYETGELLLLDDSRLSSNHWVPVPTPRLAQNMEEGQTLPFLRNELFATVRPTV